MAKRYGLEEGKILKKAVFELSYIKNDELNDPLINDDHVLLELITEDELKQIKEQTEKINEILKEFFLKADLIFGRF